jgi:hypothetical protein
MRVQKILSAVFVILAADPSFAADDLGPQTHQDKSVPRLHRFIGAIEGTGETFVGTVYIDFYREKPLPQITVSTRTGAECSGQLYWSMLGRPVEGAFLCSDGRSAQFSWSTGCAENFLSGDGDIAGRRFRFQEDLPSLCRPPDSWLHSN